MKMKRTISEGTNTTTILSSSGPKFLISVTVTSPGSNLPRSVEYMRMK